jgi:hypothetical protein
MNIMKHRVPFDSLVPTWVVFWGWMRSDYVIPCGCLISNLKRIYCKYRPDRLSKKYRNEKLYDNGSNRFFQEIDIVHLLKSVRLFRLYISSMTDQKQRVLLEMQRQQVISSDSSDQGLSDDQPDILQQSLIPNSLASVFAVGKANRLLKQYVGQKLSPFDQRLLKGFYVSDNHELKHENEKDKEDMTKVNF